jgi:hypothetical protein
MVGIVAIYADSGILTSATEKRICYILFANLSGLKAFDYGCIFGKL